MVKHKHSAPRSKTRAPYRKNVRKKGMAPINKMLQKFSVGDKVHIKVDSSVHKGMPFRRFLGLTGTVSKQIGDCYEIMIHDRRKAKKIIVHPAHLQKQTEKK